MLCCKLLGLSAGCFSHGEVEDSNPRGPDILPYACAAWDAGCLYQVGYVCRECQMQSVSQERYAFLPHTCVTVGRCHLSMPCLGNVPLLLSLCLWLYFEFWPSGFTHSEALISQKRLTLTSINHSDETGTESCKTLQCCYPLDIQGTWTQVVYKSFCGSFCATVHFSVSFMSWNGLWVSKPCQLIPSLTEGTSKKRLGKLMHPVTE